MRRPAGAAGARRIPATGQAAAASHATPRQTSAASSGSAKGTRLGRSGKGQTGCSCSPGGSCDSSPAANTVANPNPVCTAMARARAWLACPEESCSMAGASR